VGYFGNVAPALSAVNVRGPFAANLPKSMTHSSSESIPVNVPDRRHVKFARSGLSEVFSRMSLPSSAKEEDNYPRGPAPGSRRTHPNTPGIMRPGSDQRSRGHYNSNRLLQQPQRNQFFDSNGPNIKIRGNAPQLVERYVGLAQEAAIGGDRIAAENFNQHAEHYLRVANASREGNQQGAPRPSTPADIEMSPSETGSREVADRSQPRLNVDDPDSMNHVGNDRGD
jgi:hypothetical protein